MSWFNWWKELKSEALVAKKEEVRQEEKVLEGEVVLEERDLLKPGSRWCIRRNEGDPFPNKRRSTAEVLETKEGWVRYTLGHPFNDERREIEEFLKIYEIE